MQKGVIFCTRSIASNSIAELSRFWTSAPFREEFQTVCSIHLLFKLPSTISLRSLAVHKTGVRQDMVLGFLRRNELVASAFTRFCGLVPGRK
jgi:hypothetical protein